MQVHREVHLGPRQSPDTERGHPLPLDEQVQGVLVLRRPVALGDHLLEERDEHPPRLRPALQEADAFAHQIPGLGHHLLSERDDATVLDVDLHLFPRVLEPLVDQECVRLGRAQQPEEELAREHDVGVHDERGAPEDVAGGVEGQRGALGVVGIVQEFDRHALRRPRRLGPHSVRAMPDHEHRAAHAGGVKRLEHPREDGPAADGQERLVRPVGQRGEALGAARHEDHRRRIGGSGRTVASACGIVVRAIGGL